MPDLSTTYLGLPLKNPLVPSSTPLSRDLDAVLHLEDAGAAAIVMHSLFEEDVRNDEQMIDRFLIHPETFGEAAAICRRPRLPEQARRLSGADPAPEVPPGDPGRRQPERLDRCPAGSNWAANWRRPAPMRWNSTPGTCRASPRCPARRSRSATSPCCGTENRGRHPGLPEAVALLLVPAAFRHQAEAAGAAGVSLFNRFFQPDIDLETLSVVDRVQLSTSADTCSPCAGSPSCVARHRSPGRHRRRAHGRRRAEDAARRRRCAHVASASCCKARRRLPGCSRHLALAGRARIHVGRPAQRLDEPAQPSEPRAFARSAYLNAIDSFTPPTGVRY
jgi:dihydroorotate dehydrogenase (fumarate)